MQLWKWRIRDDTVIVGVDQFLLIKIASTEEVAEDENLLLPAGEVFG